MPRGVYIRKPEYLKKLSDAKKGKPSPRKGRKFGPLGELHRIRSGRASLGNKSRTGMIASPEHRRKLREANKRYWKSVYGQDYESPKHGWAKHQQRLRANGGVHSLGEWETLKAQYNWRCPSCLKSEPVIELTKDHIIPVLRGGSDNIENIQPLCRSCNSKKRTQEVRFKIN